MEDVYVHLRVKRDLKEQLEEEAKKLNISLNAYINLILSKKIK